MRDIMNCINEDGQLADSASEQVSGTAACHIPSHIPSHIPCHMLAQLALPQDKHGHAPAVSVMHQLAGCCQHLFAKSLLCKLRHSSSPDAPLQYDISGEDHERANVLLLLPLLE